ncbi:hypothetical protein STENM327S_02069 [Streptomyces tendae]
MKDLLSADRSPTWEGWAAVERISEEYGIHDVNLVKPGVGETTRVMLRRVPWKVLALAGAGADLDHVRLLAEQRGVPVEEVAGLPYTCVGLIHPQYAGRHRRRRQGGGARLPRASRQRPRPHAHLLRGRARTDHARPGGHPACCAWRSTRASPSPT